jgi:hypothetical protein
MPATSGWAAGLGRFAGSIINQQQNAGLWGNGGAGGLILSPAHAQVLCSYMEVRMRGIEMRQATRLWRGTDLAGALSAAPSHRRLSSHAMLCVLFVCAKCVLSMC